MKVVIDTNVLLVSMPSKTRFRPIFEAFVNGKISLVLTTSIYLEYVEILQNQAGKGVAEYFKDMINASENVILPPVSFHWNLITIDPDDNKFIDAYIAANADYLVTNDAHFNEAKKLNFPPLNIVTADEFLNILIGAE